MSSFLKEPTTQQFKVSSLTICLDFFLRTAIAAQKQFFDFFWTNGQESIYPACPLLPVLSLKKSEPHH